MKIKQNTMTDLVSLNNKQEADQSFNILESKYRIEQCGHCKKLMEVKAGAIGFDKQWFHEACWDKFEGVQNSDDGNPDTLSNERLKVS